MRDLAVLILHVLATVARLAGPGGARAVVAESVLVKQQLLMLNRSRRRSPNLRLADRVVAGVCTLLVRPSRLNRVAIALKPSRLLRLHRALTTRKYRRLFSSTVAKRPGPKGPAREVIAAVVDMKQRNPTWGCPRIARAECRGSPEGGAMGIAVWLLNRSTSDSWPGSGMRRTVCGASICFGANRPCCACTGCWWSWISARVASSALACTAAPWMARGCVACSIERRVARPHRDTLVRTTISCTNVTNGRPTCASSTWKKSRQIG